MFGKLELKSKTRVRKMFFELQFIIFKLFQTIYSIKKKENQHLIKSIQKKFKPDEI